MGSSRPVLPGRGAQGGPQPPSPSLTKALGGVEPKSHCLPVPHVRLQTAGTKPETAAPAGRLPGSGSEPAKPRLPGPLPFAPDHAPGRAHCHCAPSRGAGWGSPTDRSPRGSRPLLTSARSGLGKGRDTNFQLVHSRHRGTPRGEGVLIPCAPPPADPAPACRPPLPRSTGPARPPATAAPGPASSAATQGWGRGSLTRWDARSSGQLPGARSPGAVVGSSSAPGRGSRGSSRLRPLPLPQSRTPLLRSGLGAPA